MLKLIRYLKPYAGKILCAIALLLVQAMCDLALPDYMAGIVNKGVMTGDTGYIWRTGGVMLLVSLLGAVSAVAVGYMAATVASGVSHDLRRDVFKKVQEFSSAEYDKFSTSSLITRTTNDITQIQMLVIMIIRMVCYAPIMGIGGSVKALRSSPEMSWIIAAAVVCLIGVIIALFTVAMPRFRTVQKLIDRLSLISRENLEGMPVIRAFNTQGFEKERFDKANRELADTNLFVNRAMSLMMPTMMLIMNVTGIIVIWVGSSQVASMRMGVGDMMAYMQYSMQVIMSFLMLAMMFIMIPRAAVSADRVAEVLSTKESILDPKMPEAFPEDFKGEVTFDNVSFRFPESSEDVLRGLSFTAKAGSTTAIIGATGSGKSTLVNLVMRFYDVTGGRILIDGKDIRAVTRKELRGKIGYVPQKAVLFSGTVRSNISYGDKNADGAAIEKAARTAQADGFIEARDEGYDSAIAQGGGNVSGGQRQRLSIARALVKNAPVYIIDDSFSALDLKTDAKLRAALKSETGGSTVLMVTQRVGTIMDADMIIVLENGEIAGIGTHKELLESCEVYREIARSQLSGEELAG